MSDPPQVGTRNRFIFGFKSAIQIVVREDLSSRRNLLNCYLVLYFRYYFYFVRI